MNRSYLFIPGNTPSMVQTLDVFDADAIILDLEDSVEASEKDAALDLVHQFITQFKIQDVAIYVRVNELTSSLKKEIKALNHTPIKGYVVPKANQHTLRQVETLTDKDIIALIETPRSVLNALEIADFKQVKGLILGAEDLTTTLHINRTLSGQEINFARHQIIYAAHAANIEAIDTPFTDPTDESGLEADILIAKQIGFTGKTAIHPNQVHTINQHFVPSMAEITQARRIVLKAKQTQKGAFSLDGKMIDKPIIDKAKALVLSAVNYGIISGNDDV